MKKTTKVATGIITAAIVACAVYFLTGEKGKKNMEKIKQIAAEMKKELLEKMMGLKKITKEEYDRIIDEIEDKYRRVKKVSQAEISKVIDTMRDAWSHIEKEIKR